MQGRNTPGPDRLSRDRQTSFGVSDAMQGNDTISELVAELRKAVIEAERDRPQREIDPPQALPKPSNDRAAA
jgi:hypothetical protein